MCRTFENLVKNCVEAQPDGGFLRISLHLLQQTEVCRIEIENGGFVLNQEESKLLFEPYFTSKSKGTGLGLVISKKIIEAHKGELEWDADYTKQTVQFVISLPLV